METNSKLNSNWVISTILAAMLSLAPALALAADAAPGTTNTDHPCKQVVSACQSAGYVKKGHKQGKGLYKDCVQPLMAGQTVPNVTVDSTTVQACQAKKTARHQQQQAKTS